MCRVLTFNDFGQTLISPNVSAGSAVSGMVKLAGSEVIKAV